MNILLAFAPFIAFVFLERTLGAEPGLAGAAAVALALLIYDALIRQRTPKVLEIGTVILFGALASYGAVNGMDWSVAGVRLAVDGGLLLIVLVSMAIRQPFTLQYARETSPRELWDQPDFIRTNYVITAVWDAAFAIMVAVDLAWLVMPNLPPRVVIIVTLLAIVGAVKFTGWYPHRVRAAASPRHS
jgi:hypothetical protein